MFIMELITTAMYLIGRDWVFGGVFAGNFVATACLLAYAIWVKRKVGCGIKREMSRPFHLRRQDVEIQTPKRDTSMDTY